VNKVEHQHTSSEMAYIREGVAAARCLADELERAAAPFLQQQPARRTKSDAMARRAEFKDAMRRRIRDIAGSRDLSDEEIKPALTLKHHQIANFAEKHGVNLEWLFEGKGRVFETDPITVNSSMTGKEFAAVLGQMPLPDQQMIRGMIDQILEEFGA
jgi:hypothetical protein